MRPTSLMNSHPCKVAHLHVSEQSRGKGKACKIEIQAAWDEKGIDKSWHSTREGMLKRNAWSLRVG